MTQMKKGRNLSIIVPIITGTFVVLAALVTGIFSLLSNNSPVIHQEFYVNDVSSAFSVANAPGANPNSDTVSNSPDTSSAVTGSIVRLSDLPLFNCQYLYNETWESTELISWNPLQDRGADGNLYPNGYLLEIYQPFHKTFKAEYLLNGQYRSFSTGFLLSERFRSSAETCVWKIYGDGKELYVSPPISGGFVPSETGEIDLTDITKLTIQIEYAQEQHGSSGGIVLTDLILTVK